MNKGFRLFITAALAVAVGVAFLLSPYASSAPDGLEKVAEDNGFTGKAAEPAWAHAPMPNYGVSTFDSLSTPLAGAAGTLLAFAAAVGLAALLRKRRARKEPS